MNTRSRSRFKIQLEPKPWREAKKLIGDGLDDYNVAEIKALGIKANESQFIYCARNSRGKIVGGFYCIVYFQTCFLKWAWVDGSARRTGAGQDLMAACEAEARKRGATVFYLDTFSFQARPFYEKLGFKVFGTLALGAKGVKRYWMVKKL